MISDITKCYFGSLKPQIEKKNQDGGIHRRPFPPDHIVDLEEAAMGWVLRLDSRTSPWLVKSLSFSFHAYCDIHRIRIRIRITLFRNKHSA